MDERNVINAWRELFRDKKTTPETLAAAEALLNGLSGESPIRFRLASELEELKKRLLHQRKSRTVADRQTE